MTLDLTHKPSKVVFYNKTESRVFGDPNDRRGIVEPKMSKKFTTGNGSLSQRNPIIGRNVPLEEVSSGKK